MTAADQSPQSRKAVIVVARRLDGMKAGNSQYLGTYLKLCQKIGLETTIVFAPRRAFGNVAWARMHPEIHDVVSDIVWNQTVRIGDRIFSTSPEVWGRFAVRLIKELGRRLTRRTDVPVPSMLGVELSRSEARQTLEQVNGLFADYVTAEYSSLAPLLNECNARRRIVLLHDLFSLRAEAFQARGKTPDHAVMSLEEEAERCKAADILIHASRVELDQFAPVLPDATHVWMRPGIGMIERSSAADTTPHAVFVGSLHAGNIDGLAYLRSKIWPAVRAQMPDAMLHIVGKLAGRVNSSEAEDEGLRLVGAVEDLASIGGPNAIGLAPPQLGSGIPIKVVDYLALGMPVVVTRATIAPFGDALDGVVAVAETDQHYVETIVDLLKDQQRRRALSDATNSISERLDNAQLANALTKDLTVETKAS